MSATIHGISRHGNKEKLRRIATEAAATTKRRQQQKQHIQQRQQQRRTKPKQQTKQQQQRQQQPTTTGNSYGTAAGRTRRIATATATYNSYRGGRRRHGEYGDQNLLTKTVTEKTHQRYTKSVIEFCNWVIANHDDAEDMEEFDDLLCDYIHELHRAKRGYSKASMIISAIINLAPEFKHQLPRSKQAVKGWTKTSPGGSYPPLTWELAVVLAVHMVKHGMYREGVGTLLGFDCMLRIGELTNLRRCDVVDNEDLRISGEHKGLILRLTKTKTGPNKWVDVRQPEVKELLRQLVKSVPAEHPQQRLFPFTGPQYRYQMKKACAQLGLSQLYVPHSLRHGGATRYYSVLKMPIEDVLFRGRWASNESARRYIQSGIAMLMSFESNIQMQRGKDIITNKSGGILLHMALAQKHWFHTTSSGRRLYH